MRDLLVNKIKCPDGTILESRYRHDFQRHVQEDGREYFVDGGLDYIHVGGSDGDYETLAVFSDSPHEKIRSSFVWGNSLDKDGKPLPEVRYLPIKDLTDGHIQALVLWTKTNYPEKIKKVFEDEAEYRGLDHV